MKRILFFDNSPDLNASLRFFLNVPIFLILASALLLWAGSGALTSRWTPAALALTHLLTLGVLASAMIGALLQILPVTTSIYVARTRLTAIVVHITLTAGTVLLAASFMLNDAVISHFAMVLLAIAFGWLLIATAIGFRTHRQTRTAGSAPLLGAVRLALIALLITVALGISLLAARAWGTGAVVSRLSDIHAAWGLLGWVGLLLLGVTFKVLPVFQATELYPQAMMRWWAQAIFATLAAWTLTVIWPLPRWTWLASVAGLCLAVMYFAYAGVSLRLLYGRKRPGPDAITRFWRVAMVCFAACLPIWIWWRIGHQPHSAVLLGILMIVGVAVTAINGMLYKILPVLLWNHAQMPLERALPQVPKVKDILPDQLATKQFRAHLIALILLLLAARWPAAFSHLAAIAMAFSALWLGRNMAYAIRIYVRAKVQIAGALKREEDTLRRTGQP